MIIYSITIQISSIQCKLRFKHRCFDVPLKCCSHPGTNPSQVVLTTTDVRQTALLTSENQ